MSRQSEEQTTPDADRTTPEEDYRLLVENQTDLVVKVDPQGRFLFVSPSYCRLFGTRREDLLGHAFMPVVHAEDRDAADKAFRALRSPPHHGSIEQRALTALGWRWLAWSYTAVLDAAGRLTAIIGVGRDVTERKETEQALADANRRLELAIEGGEIGLYTLSFAGDGNLVDSRYLAMLGYAPGEIKGGLDGWLPLVHPDDLGRVDALLRQLIDGSLERFDAEYRMRHRNGHWVWIQDRGRVYERDTEGKALRIAGTHMDITRRKVAELRLEYLVDHDELTGLLNRRGVWQSIQRIFAQSRRTGRPCCLAILDLDHFKLVNDAYGHAFGDQVLQRVADLLRRGIRQADWLGRWGGEEFVIALPETNEVQARIGLERLREAISAQPIEVEGRRIGATLSVGFASCQAGEDDPREVLARADMALYQAKNAGRNRVCYDGHEGATHAVSVAVLVQDALETARILPAFQPIVELGTRRLVAEEALARILSSDGRVLTAASFIEIARQLGLLHRIDRMLLGAAAARLREKFGSAKDRVLDFVHLSGDLIRYPDLLAAVASEIEAIRGSDGGFAPLVLTLSDRQITAETEQVAKSLAPLLRLGCRVAVNDYGGDTSSFRFLVHLPVSFIQIDAGLVRLASESERAKTVLATIQRIAHDLGITTIAKQVEDAETLQRLIDLGIDWGSGYFIGRPSEPVA